MTSNIRIEMVFMTFLQILSPALGYLQTESGNGEVNNDRDLIAIESALQDYIQGSTQGQPDRLKRVFHKDLNLYSILDRKLQVWSGNDYIRSTQSGKPTDEDGKIIAIDFENDTAVAKVKVLPRDGARPFVDYFMLLKINQQWKIIHKMYTRESSRRGSFGDWSALQSSHSRKSSEPRTRSNQSTSCSPEKERSTNVETTLSDFERPASPGAAVSEDGERQNLLAHSARNAKSNFCRISMNTGAPDRGNSKIYSDIEQIVRQLDSTASQCLKQQHLPGLAVVVVKDGQTVLKRGYGLANVSQNIAVDPETTIFRIGSVSKALTFLVLARLIDQGRINRDDPVEKYIGSISNRRGFKTDITIDHLLTHTAGFDQIGVGRHVYQNHLDLKRRKAMRPSLTKFLNDNNLRRVTDAGEMFRYDTYGTTLAGAIIEKVTGKQFAAAMKDQMFDCLGMNHTRPCFLIGVGKNLDRWQPP